MTELYIYPDLSSSKPGLFQVSAGDKTIQMFAVSAIQILKIVHDIKRGRWWSLDTKVKLIRHDKQTNKFNTHDIVNDGTYEGRIYKALDLDGTVTSYDVVLPGGHAVRSESELTLVRKYIKTVWSSNEK